ncbi:uncharacterized protein V1510DRAFT_367844 [Dipodascopsis tothii]|uniref:uncharacterized protein n=1 Tax=Dipodascopsis tothii TaxID=44089 RepID=UPI0034CD71CF
MDDEGAAELLATVSSILTTASETTAYGSEPTGLGLALDAGGNIGYAQNTYGQSLETFVSSLTASLSVFGFELAIFLLIRKRIRRVYEPKTYVVPKRQRVPPTGSGLLDWINPTIFTPDSELIEKCGLDTYFFLRFLFMLIIIFAGASFIVLPILLPLNSHRTGNDPSDPARGLDRYAWVNVGADTTQRYWAHLVLAIIFVIFVCWVFYHELQVYVDMRQRYLISPQHRMRASATTVLIRAVPRHLLHVDRIKTVFDVYPGGVRNVWINRDFEKLSKKIRERDAVALTLEAAETTLIQRAHAVHKRRLKQGATQVAIEERALLRPVWRQYLSKDERPWHRLPFLGLVSMPFLSRKVDTIDWTRERLSKLNDEIEEMKRDETAYPLMNSCFIQFNNQIAAHMACQSLASERPHNMVPRLIEVNPRDIQWPNMRIKWWESFFRVMFTTMLAFGLIFFWAIPVAFVGAVSQLSYLTHAVPFLAWVDNLPVAIKGIISGILPPAALSALMALLPYILLFFASLDGSSTGTEIQMTVQGSYFAFLFIQVFLVVTIASSVTTVIEQLTNNPASIPMLLATNLPKASNFFFSYLILQGLAVSASAILQVGPLVSLKFVGPLSDQTARQKFERVTTLSFVRWGTFYPMYTNLAAIGLVYAIVAPLILPMCVIAFSLFYLAYRYQFLYCQVSHIDSAGLHFHRAINQLFTGLYLMEISLIGLFFLVRDLELNATCRIHGLIMVFVLICTAIYQFTLNRSFSPLFKFLPVQLEGKARKDMRDWEATQTLQQKLGEGDGTATEASRRSGRNTIRSYASIATGRTDSKVLHTQDDFATANESYYAHSEEETGDTTALLAAIESGDSSATDGTEMPIQAASDDDEPAMVIPSLGSQLLAVIRHPLTKTAETAKVAMQRTTPILDAGKMSLKHLADFVYTGHDPVEADLTGETSTISRPVVHTANRHLFDGVEEELEDFSPEQREYLVDRAFKNSALRAKTPVIWIPNDSLGIAEDEIAESSGLYRNIYMSSDGAALDAQGKVVFFGRPPDYDPESKINL